MHAATRVLALAALIGLPVLPVAAGDLELLMIEEHGCVYCTRWNAEVAPEYPLTDEGRAAPLLRVQKSDQPFAAYSLDGRVVYTPTFVLMRDGVEVSRLEGYPGEDFFWGLLARMIDSANTTAEK